MNSHPETPPTSPSINTDPAAQFAIAHSLWQACHDHAAKQQGVNLSETFNGMDECMRVVMQIGERFERWACEHVRFENLNEVWPYLLQDRFGDACLELITLEGLTGFTEEDCLRMALALGLPVIVSASVPVPLSLWADNPVKESPFRRFLIQTVRHRDNDEDVERFVEDDDPYDADCTPPWFALYGELEDKRQEHILDRDTYESLRRVVLNIVPQIELPVSPCSNHGAGQS